MYGSLIFSSKAFFTMALKAHFPPLSRMLFFLQFHWQFLNVRRYSIMEIILFYTSCPIILLSPIGLCILCIYYVYVLYCIICSFIIICPFIIFFHLFSFPYSFIIHLKSLFKGTANEVFIFHTWSFNFRWDDDVVFKNCAKDDDKPKV